VKVRTIPLHDEMTGNCSSEESPLKRQKLAAEGADPICVDAADLIRIEFVNSQVNSDRKCCTKPDYTHQVFENEKVAISILSGRLVTVVVDCRNLEQGVRFSGVFSEAEESIVRHQLSRALPDDNQVENTPPVASNTLSHPPGQLVCKFTQKSLDGTLELYRATAHDTGASSLLHRAEKLAVWFIETADSVDFSDDRWEVLFLYANHAPTSAAASALGSREFIGYMTLFSFRNPIHGTKIRVCQALVLPPWQGRGLGREMLLRVYEHIVHAREDVSELTVEDPCHGFQRLRDAVDLELLVGKFPTVTRPLHESTSATVSYTQDTGGSDVSDTKAVHEGPGVLDELVIAKALKVIKPQAQFLCECLDFFELVRSTTVGSQTLPETDVVGNQATLAQIRPLVSAETLQAHPDFKEFRLKVKKRILKNDKDIAALPKADKQAALSEEFEVELKRFMALLKTASRLGLV
jgi:GNAT superfamily N-acetyltransferase